MSDPIILEGDSYGRTAEADMALAGKIMTELQRHYPDHWWDVAVSNEAGTAAVALLYPNRLGMVSHMGVLLHISSLGSEEGMRRVMLAGGELLERRKLPRRGYRDGDFQKAIENDLDKSGALH